MRELLSRSFSQAELSPRQRQFVFLNGVGINGKQQDELSKASALDTDKPGSDPDSAAPELDKHI